MTFVSHAAGGVIARNETGYIAGTYKAKAVAAFGISPLVAPLVIAGIIGLGMIAYAYSRS